MPNFGWRTAIGIAVPCVLPHQWALLTRALVGWNSAVLLLLPMTYLHLRGLTPKQLRDRYRADDPSAPVILLVVVAAAGLSVAAIVAFLTTLKSVPPSDKVAHILLATLTIIDSWLLVPSMFTVHYADMFYSAEVGDQPLLFPETPEPVFWDFVYFSFTISAACQTADVSTRKVGIRRVVTFQSVIAFLFNVAILGFAINVTAGLLFLRRVAGRASACRAAECRDGRGQSISCNGFDQMNLEPGLDRVGTVLRPGKCSQGDRRQFLRTVAALADGSNQLIAIFLGHADVADQHRRLGCLQQCERFVRTGRLGNTGARIQQHP